MSSVPEIPVHSSLDVMEIENIYRTEEWWKAAIRYQYNPDDEYDETAIYMWHKDGEWNRKNKYVIKTVDAWKTDKTIIERLFSGDISSRPDGSPPVSDYYEVGAGETVFQSGGWWKAILKIIQKGSYETEEIMMYLWQETDDEWRRRQKYTIKDEESWRDEIAAVESVIGSDSGSDRSDQSDSDRKSSSDVSVEEFEQLNREIESHLSEETRS